MLIFFSTGDFLSSLIDNPETHPKWTCIIIHVDGNTPS